MRPFLAFWLWLSLQCQLETVQSLALASLNLTFIKDKKRNFYKWNKGLNFLLVCAPNSWVHLFSLSVLCVAKKQMQSFLVLGWNKNTQNSVLKVLKVCSVQRRNFPVIYICISQKIKSHIKDCFIRDSFSLLTYYNSHMKHCMSKN